MYHTDALQKRSEGQERSEGEKEEQPGHLTFFLSRFYFAGGVHNLQPAPGPTVGCYPAVIYVPFKRQPGSSVMVDQQEFD